MWSEWVSWVDNVSSYKESFYLTEIIPDDDARIAAIIDDGDFLTAYSRYPAEKYRRVAIASISWTAMAQDGGFDAILVADSHGSLQNKIFSSNYIREHLPPDTQPILGMFDCVTVWWARPMFALGKTERMEGNGQEMTTTRYGTWCRVEGYSLTVEQTVEDAFGPDGHDGFDLDAIVRDYRDAINDALPPGVSLVGNEFIGPYPYDRDGGFDGYPVTEDGILDIKEIIDGIGLWEIIGRHDHTS